jgi:nucleoside-diphosphate-sugar epimerase
MIDHVWARAQSILPPETLVAVWSYDDAVERPTAGAIERVLVLGCGYAGAAVARLARARDLGVVTSVRSDDRAAVLRAEGFVVLQREALDAATLAEHVDATTHVVVAFPPDGVTDARIAGSLGLAGALTYLSSTGVYGDHRGVVDDRTPVAASPKSERVARLIATEQIYLTAGGAVLRCPALYGRDRGLHVRVLRGEHAIPGDGSRYISRIHVEDLAALVLGATSLRGQARVVGDLEPAPHVEVIRFICDSYGVPMPPFVPLESVHESLRADRRVDASTTLAELGVTLRYPTYREGVSASVTGLVAGR